MVDFKRAVATAKQFAAETLGTDDLLLEELQSSDTVFDVTLSFPARLPALRLGNISGHRGRELKRFAVDKATGEVRGMTIRTL